MPQVKKLDIDGNEIAEINLEETIFNEKINELIVHKVVTAQLATKRRGTASTKTRSEVRGGGRKPWRQKGTGRARHGSIRSPLWVGGGITFGPKPRDYTRGVTKKEKKLALKSIFSHKTEQRRIIILDELDFPEIKTKQVVELLEKLNLKEQKVLIILPEKNDNIYYSCRNLPEIKTLLVAALNAYDLLDNDYIIIPDRAVLMIEEVLGG